MNCENIVLHITIVEFSGFIHKYDIGNNREIKMLTNTANDL